MCGWSLIADRGHATRARSQPQLHAIPMWQRFIRSNVCCSQVLRGLGGSNLRWPALQPEPPLYLVGASSQASLFTTAQGPQLQRISNLRCQLRLRHDPRTFLHPSLRPGFPEAVGSPARSRASPAACGPSTSRDRGVLCQLAKGSQVRELALSVLAE